MTIEDKVKEIIFEQLGTPCKDIRGESSFIDDLGADSLDMAEMIMTIEEEFDVVIDDMDAEGLRTVSDLIERLNNKYPDACHKFTATI
jgi:acyl carrier protein